MVTMTPAERATSVEARAKQLQEFWRLRDLQWLLDRALLALQYKKRVLPFENVISNEPAVLHGGAMAILGGKPPRYRLPITVQEQGEIIKMDKGERLLYAIMQEVDKRWRMKGHGPWLLDLLHYGLLGAVAVQPRIVKAKGKPPEFHADLFDPLNVYPQYGDNGLVEVARIYDTTWEHARSMCAANGWNGDVIKKSEFITIVNYWCLGEEDEGEDPEVPYNTVLMAGMTVKERAAHAEFSRIPVQIVPLNGIPWRAFNIPGFELTPEEGIVTGDWTAQWGRPIFWANRHLYRTLDRVLTYEADRMRKMAKAKYLALTKDGQVVFSEQEFEKAEVITLNASEGEGIKPIEEPAMPREGYELINQIFNMTQRAGLNRLALGDLTIEISGVTLERAAASARYVLEPYADGIQQVLADIGMSFFEQARKMNLRTFSLEVRQQKLGADMSFLVEEYTRNDIPKTTAIAVELPMLLPDDRMRKATIARTLIPGNIPLADRQSVAEEILEIQDWTLSQQKIKEDMLETDPAVQMVERMAAIQRKIEQWQQTPGYEGAAQMAGALLQQMQQQFLQVTAPREQGPGKLQPGGGAPAPSEQPPEERGAGSSNMEMLANTPSKTPTNGRALANALGARERQG